MQASKTSTKVTVDFWRFDPPELIRTYFISVGNREGTELSARRAIASILPAATNEPPDPPFYLVYAPTELEAKDAAVAAIRARPENEGLFWRER